ncbi:hypothetical protein SDC9_119584 [bioreactor metagenome]|uniref:Uncharacterized protein n=1 Tax=bioreactor metagenome TaxID=1076179 RepID=A0A645C5F9_9ZZZZ
MGGGAVETVHHLVGIARFFHRFHEKVYGFAHAGFGGCESALVSRVRRDLSVIPDHKSTKDFIYVVSHFHGFL